MKSEAGVSTPTVPFRLSWRDFAVVALVSALYLAVSALLIGFKSDQLVLIAIFSSLYLASSITRKFILGFSIFIVFWIIFDYMKAFPNYHYNAVHIRSLYDAERSWFGILHEGQVYIPSAYFNLIHFTTADVMAGVFYLCWIPVPLGFAAFLFFHNRAQFIRFSLTFLLVNLLGFVVYYLYPAAPPWYISTYGFTFQPGTPGNTGGLLRFDQFFNISVFQSLYSKSSNVFAAMPSLHSAYPLIVTYFGIKNKLGWINAIFIVITLGIWMAAVYTSHHYVLDVLAGILIAIFGTYLFSSLERYHTGFRNFLDAYLRKIS